MCSSSVVMRITVNGNWELIFNFLNEARRFASNGIGALFSDRMGSVGNINKWCLPDCKICTVRTPEASLVSDGWVSNHKQARELASKRQAMRWRSKEQGATQRTSEFRRTWHAYNLLRSTNNHNNIRKHQDIPYLC